MDTKRIHEDDQDPEVIPEVEDELGGWGEYEEGP